MYYYQGFGIYITSEIELPELFPIPLDQLDAIKKNTPKFVSIKLGSTPEKLKGDDVTEFIYSWGRPNEYLIEIIDIARYHITNGHTIIIEPLGQPNWKDIRLFLLNSPIAALLYQRNALILKAAAIQTTDGIVLICGHSGLGKSTILGLLKQRGYTLFSDTMCVIYPEQIQENSITTFSDYPTIKLWRDSINLINDATLFNKNWTSRDGFKCYLNSFKSDFVTKAMPISKIIYLSVQSKDLSFYTKTITSYFEKITTLNQFVFQKNQLEGHQITTINFKKIASISKAIPAIIEISRPTNNVIDFINFTNTIEREL